MLYSANLGFLYADLALPDAVRAAAGAGFDALECHFPFETPPSDLAAALLRLAGDRALRRSLGAAGRARVDAHFALPVMLDALSEHYRQLWGAAPHAEPAALPEPEAPWT